MDFDYIKTAEFLNNGNVVFLPTDTIYGLSASALNKRAVEKIYRIKKRDYDKPFIILIGNLGHLDLLGIDTNELPNNVKRYWPGPNTLILPCKSKQYLHRGLESLAIRMPNYASLTNLLDLTGPVVSTSANIQNKPPITSASEARKLFGDSVDKYVDVGVLSNKPSSLFRIDENKLVKIR